MKVLTQLGIESVNPGASCGNKWLQSGSRDEIIVSENPSTQKEIGHVLGCSQNQYEQVIEATQKAFESWRMMPAPKRGELVRMIGLLLREHKEALGSLVALEMGKSKQEGDGEVQEMIDIADFAVGQSRMLYGLMMHSERRQHRMYEQWHPLGVVGVISSFNFPVAVWSWNAFIAAICGNTVIWKPSTKTPLCAIAVQKLCHQAMQAFGVEDIFNVIIPKDHTIAENFVKDKRIPLISFTGSCQAGSQVAQKVIQRMGKTILELGGNNAIIVDETANLSLAIPAIVFGAVGTAGQRCTTTRRLFVHESRYEEVCERLKHTYEQITIGDPLDSRNLMGPLIDKGAVDHYLAAIEELKQHKAEILFGGEVLEKPGYFVKPTLVKAKNEWPVVQRETFAPILYVMSYRTLEEAIALQNGVVQGLSSALFTDSLQNSELFLSHVGSDCGIANINIGTSGAEIGGAFGGEKETGGGREAGSDAWKAYMRRQTTTLNWGKTLPLAQGIKFELE